MSGLKQNRCFNAHCTEQSNAALLVCVKLEFVMGIVGRFVCAVEAKIASIIENAYDPNEELALMYQKHLAKLIDTRNKATKVETSINLIRSQLATARSRVAREERIASDALAAGKTDEAREAVTNKLFMESQIKEIEGELADAEANSEVLKKRIKALDAGVNAIRIKREFLAAQYNCADAQAQIAEALTGTGDSEGDAGAIVERVKNKTEERKAKAKAISTMVSEGLLVDASALGTRDISDGEIDAELQRLKSGAKSA